MFGLFCVNRKKGQRLNGYLVLIELRSSHLWIFFPSLPIWLMKLLEILTFNAEWQSLAMMHIGAASGW